jgi:hypothetical protein
MLNNRGNKLDIFENFQTDNSLPKFTQGEKIELGRSIPVGSSTGFIISGNVMNSNWGTITVPANSPDSDWFSGEVNGAEKPVKKGWFSTLFDSFKTKKKEQKKTMTILNFFSSLAQSLNDLKGLQDIAIHYESAISAATKAGQTALVDKLKTRLESAKTEVQLVNLGLNKYILEEQIIDFYKRADKDQKLKLTWIKHFVKPIPSKILDVKENLDKQFVFDNYVILHYDPHNDATDLTKVEQEEIKKREKDPIIFGVIKDSRRLYYVGDWIDEYCSLTLDVLLETLQERVNVVNNDNVKTYLDTGIRQENRQKLPPKFPAHYGTSAMTFQMPSLFEKVEEKVEQAKEVIKPMISRIFKKDTKKSKPIKTSSGEKLRKLGKKKKNGKK